MDGREPKFTVVKGLATNLVLELVDERNVKEDLSGVTQATFFMTSRPGSSPMIQLDAEVNESAGTVAVALENDAFDNIAVGTYIAAWQLTIDGQVYQTNRCYIEVQHRIGTPPQQ